MPIDPPSPGTTMFPNLSSWISRIAALRAHPRIVGIAAVVVMAAIRLELISLGILMMGVPVAIAITRSRAHLAVRVCGVVAVAGIFLLISAVAYVVLGLMSGDICLMAHACGPNS